MEEFVGNGSLRELLPRLLEEGWDDVSALKIINSEDMNEIGMSQQHKVSLFYIVVLLGLFNEQKIHSFSSSGVGELENYIRLEMIEF